MDDSKEHEILVTATVKYVTLKNKPDDLVYLKHYTPGCYIIKVEQINHLDGKIPPIMSIFHLVQNDEFYKLHPVLECNDLFGSRVHIQVAENDIVLQYVPDSLDKRPESFFEVIENGMTIKKPYYKEYKFKVTIM